jgi:hypothetical protein
MLCTNIPADEAALDRYEGEAPALTLESGTGITTVRVLYPTLVVVLLPENW